MDREVEEAIWAGTKALQSLDDAKANLRKAKTWGFFDICGGGLISTFMKHSKIDKARSCLENAKRDLQSFANELDDIDEAMPDVDIGEFLSFADYFFDGFIADMFVQSKIENALGQVDKAIGKVEGIVGKLKQIE